MRFSIIVVTLNAGEKLKETVQSVLAQQFTDYEIVVKDGGSTDGSVEKLPQDARLMVYVRKDKGIYDAMNQAVEFAKGQYVLFLNCGDFFYDQTVLTRADAALAAAEAAMASAGTAGSGRPPDTRCGGWRRHNPCAPDRSPQWCPGRPRRRDTG